MEINYFKSKKLDLGKLKKQFEKEKEREEKEREEQKENTINKVKYNAFHITELQNYNPIYSLFFEMNEMTYNSISLNHPRHMVDLTTVFDEQQQKKISNNPSHIKYAPLLDPVHYLIGKYEKDTSKLRNLPKYNVETDTISKITSVHNTAYIDCFFSYLSSQLLNKYKFKNGIDFYGSYLGLQDKFKMDITDDYEYLLESEYFHSQKNKLYEIESLYPDLDNEIFQIKKEIKPKLILGEACELEVDIYDENELGGDVVDEKEDKKEELELVYENNKEDCSYSSNSSTNSEINSSTTEDYDDEEEEEAEEKDNETKKNEEEEEEDEWSDIDDDNSELEPQVFGYIHHFPVQMICLEKCEGTFDYLLENGMLNDDQILSALFQIIMTLITYQKAFYFTHNDLHTNNVVFITTKIEYIEYEYGGKKYNVPTYGRIFKIIDFGRSIYKFQDKLFCSDSFAPGGDAHTQYNFEPFINKNKPRLEPNFSFDLSRLGCSLYDFLFNNEDEEIIRKNLLQWTELQELIVRWCTDDNGKNIIYKKSGEERYPNFKLYKMIARTVHGCTPESQLNNPIFSRFSQQKSSSNKIYISIDNIPKLYV